MTALELADTAVKIGLGALIAGGFALLSSGRQHKQELERERMKRRERVLEKIAEEFELAYQALSAKYERIGGLANVVRDARYRPNAQDCLHGVDDFPRLHVIESRLLLLGMRAEADMMMRFRQIAGEFEKMALPEDQSHPDPQALNAKLEMLFQQRVAIYRRLAEFYDDPRKKGAASEA
jgi:hypothetical protein